MKQGEENMDRVLPILFNTDMVQAILDGRKTVTRRALKHPFEVHPNGFITKPRGNERLCHYTPPYQTDDILYVRETWRVGAWDIHNQMIAFDYKDGTCGELVHIHDRKLFERLVDQSREDARKARCEYNGVDFVWEKGKSPCRWHPSIHMPKQAARIWLKVTDVRVERLHDMTLDDFLAEGVVIRPEAFNDPENAYIQARSEFARIWDSTIRESQTDLNPYVWVIEFERCEKPEPCIIRGVEPADDERPCIGYGVSEDDDEPCEMCKGCKACSGNDD